MNMISQKKLKDIIIRMVGGESVYWQCIDRETKAVVVQLFSHVQLCDPMGCSMLGFPVLDCLTDFAQTPVHWVSDAIQPSHPLSPPSPPAVKESVSDKVSSHRQLKWKGFGSWDKAYCRLCSWFSIGQTANDWTRCQPSLLRPWSPHIIGLLPGLSAPWPTLWPLPVLVLEAPFSTW